MKQLVISQPPICPECGQPGSYTLRSGQVLDGRNPPRVLSAKGRCGHEWIGELAHQFVDERD